MILQIDDEAVCNFIDLRQQTKTSMAVAKGKKMIVNILKMQRITFS